MGEGKRTTAREIARHHLETGDSLGWFEELYARAEGDPTIIPWADLAPNPNVVEWLDRYVPAAFGFALKIGSGLGDDAEELAKRGFTTTAFDISESAVSWSIKRFPQSPVSYVVANLFSAPREWQGRFQFVLESYTLQVLPPALRPEAIQCISSFIAPGGSLLVIARGREPGEPEGNMPWPLTAAELAHFESHGLNRTRFEDYLDEEDPPVRRFRITYVKKK